MDESYEAGDVIGTGSFGIIRKVKRRPDGMILARKELNYGRMDERDLRQLTEEVNILEQLGSNDNIVRYHERFVDKPNNMLYILMEYCEGGDLAKVIQRCRNTKTYLSEDVVWAYLTQITLALYDCHAETDAHGRRKAIILHRDLKPENVFLDNENNLKLGDFGLSKAMAQAAMTQTYVGTPYYMSPELINGQPYDVKSDIWALGCLIYELCAGHPPFHEARTQPELAVMIRESKIPDLPKPYTAHLGQVVRAMLKQNPKHRPNTSQIKALDNVKLQIRAIELRKALVAFAPSSRSNIH
ncbi:kinase-like domain-containing protein [Leucosporidium creatinivorum]|uniref:non-specific serine/threonine protein kinase n=1 Tax=Leucosporidium creatinivorum TaxID=106004 RepID=A0A1Y2FU26_9BASI|nr:kinase-like domain-containing protein [Leucosporidium creatinivorum]